MDLNPGALVFADGNAGAPFLVALLLGLTLVLCVPLLRRWPPTRLRWALLVGVLAMGGSTLFLVLLNREVVVDPSAREVRQSQRVLGLGRHERWPFAAFDAVQVEYRPLSVQRRSTSPARPSDAEVHDRFVVELIGADATLGLRDFDDAAKAENLARAVAAVGAWTARRRGYEVQTGSGRPGEALAVGDVQGFEAPDGRQGIGVTLERWVRVKIREGAESPLDLPSPAGG